MWVPQFEIVEERGTQFESEGNSKLKARSKDSPSSNCLYKFNFDDSFWGPGRVTLVNARIKQMTLLTPHLPAQLNVWELFKHGKLKRVKTLQYITGWMESMAMNSNCYSNENRNSICGNPPCFTYRIYQRETKAQSFEGNIEKVNYSNGIRTKSLPEIWIKAWIIIDTVPVKPFNKPFPNFKLNPQIWSRLIARVWFCPFI